MTVSPSVHVDGLGIVIHGGIKWKEKAYVPMKRVNDTSILCNTM